MDKSILDKFNYRVNKQGSDIPYADGFCWEWTGCVSKQGYGRLHTNGKSFGAHRLSWELHNGKIPDGLHVLHKCDNRICVNPSHLFIGNDADNHKDRGEKGRTAHGECHGRSKLSETQVRIIRVYHPSITMKKLSEIFGVTEAAICMIINRINWGHVK